MKFILFFLIVLFTVKVSAQKTITVKDKYSLETIPFIDVQVIETGVNYRTDSLGIVHLDEKVANSTTILFKGVGYESVIAYNDTLKDGDDIYLLHKHTDLDEVTVSGSKSMLQRFNSVRIERKKLGDINDVSASSIGELIGSIPGVYNSSTGSGISKPVIRGMQGFRVVTMFNGVRLENQQWGGDHGLGLSELGIGSVEVIKGPASLFYGADAMGGVIYLQDEKYASQDETHVRFKTLNESVSKGTTNELFLKSSKKNIRVNFGGRFSSHSDYQMGNGLFVKDSRYSDQAIRFAIGTNRKNWVGDIRYAYYGNAIGVPGHSHAVNPKASDFMTTETKREQSIPRQDFRTHLLTVENKWFLKKVQLDWTIGKTINKLSEYEDKNTIPGIDMLLDVTYSHFKVLKKINKYELVFGVQNMYQDNSNLPKATERLIENSTSFDNGLYWVNYYHFNKAHIHFGARFDSRSIVSVSGLEKKYSGLNYSVGYVRPLKDHFRLRLNLSNGFRAPHLSELLANGFHHGALRYEIGDVNLVPENATQFDFSIEREGEHLEIMVNPYVNYIQNYTFVNKSDSIIDNLPVYHYQQMDEVFLTGVDAGFHMHPHFAHWFHWQSTFSYINFSQKGKVTLIPASRILNNVKFEINKGKNVKLNLVQIQLQSFFKQENVSTYEVSTDSYNLMNVSLHGSIGQKAHVKYQVGVKNVFNETYQDHLSRIKNIGLYQPGRNFYMQINYQL